MKTQLKLFFSLLTIFVVFSCTEKKASSIEESKTKTIPTDLNTATEETEVANIEPPSFKLISDSDKKTKSILLSDPKNFEIVVDFLKRNGVVTELNASSSIADTLMIRYYSIMVDSMRISIDYFTDCTDGTDKRIYMSNPNRFGNILISKGMVRPEINYGVLDKNPAQTKKKEKIVWDLYQELIWIAHNLK